MEEIDIIELFKRVKEGKAPKEIEIKGKKYNFIKDSPDICLMYKDSEKLSYLISEHICLDTQIKILDKPIIEELKVEEGHTDLSGLPYTVYPTKDEIIEKINQIIKHINKEEK